MQCYMSITFQQSWRKKIVKCNIAVMFLQGGRPLPGPEDRFSSNIRKWVVRGDTHADKAWDCTGKGWLGREQQGEGAQGDCSALWLAVSGFMAMGLVSGSSLASDLAWPIVWPKVLPGSSLRQDGFQREGFWEAGHLLRLLAPPEFS